MGEQQQLRDGSAGKHVFAYLSFDAGPHVLGDKVGLVEEHSDV